ncbi:Ceramide-1-phosphate transfer protein [Gryllus bimaculatus]|nr:Ceramide-1-phosphate transfer protein [Gryllus bimaculatus]
MAVVEVSTKECRKELKFDMGKVHQGFSASCIENEDVCMDDYLEAYGELYNFFQLMGAVFGFVASDVKSKIEILEELRKGTEGDNFTTLKRMVKYESEAGLLKKSNYVSGCRTFLRLHRGLDFIRLFLQRVGELQNNDKTTTVCQEAYNETLAKFHPWIVRKGAIVAMYALPTKDGFLQKVCGTPEEVARALELLPQFLEVAKEAYDRADKVYSDNSLHDLP